MKVHRIRSLAGILAVAVATSGLMAQAPAASAAASTYTQISAGDEHTCAVTSAGGVQCWGDNSYGQLGDGTTISSDGPVSVKGLSSRVKAVEAGYEDSCALTTAGSVKCWGANGHGQLGDGTTADSPVPVQVQGLTRAVTQMSAGDDSACAVVSGAAECWGYNYHGGLGNGTTTDSDVPVQVQGLTGGVTQVSVGDAFTCAIVSKAAECWGYNYDGELGNGTTTDSDVPVAVSALTAPVGAISAGGFHTCAVLQSPLIFLGFAECWGDNGDGQLGDGKTTNSDVPVPVSNLTTGVGEVSAGGFHTCAVVSTPFAFGTAKCWGEDNVGQLGDGTTTFSNVPVSVSGLTSGVAEVSAGRTHTCAVTSAGIAECWGFDDVGQLGDGTTGGTLGYHDTPVAVANQTTLKLSAKTSVAQGSKLSLKASVKSSAGIPTGVVAFYIDGTYEGAPGLNPKGKATLAITVTPSLSVGTHQVWAVYEGTPPFGGSHNVPKMLTVTP